MTNTRLAILTGCGFLLGLAIGRFSLPAKIVTKTVTVESDKSKSTDNLHQDDHSITTVTETKRPDGTITVVTTKQNNIDTQHNSTTQSSSMKSSDTEKTVTYNTNIWSLNVLAKSKASFNEIIPVYGGQIEYRILGPIKISVMGFSDSTMGVGLGLQF